MEALKRVFTSSMPLAVLIYLWIAQEAAANGKDPGFVELALFASVMAASVAALGWLAWVMVRGFLTAQPTVLLDAEDRLLGSLAANQWVGMEARGGRLFFTTQRLYFVPHNFNFQREIWFAAWHEVLDIRANPRTLEIVTAMGAAAFVVPNPVRVAGGLIALLQHPDPPTAERVRAIPSVLSEPAELRKLTARVGRR